MFSPSLGSAGDGEAAPRDAWLTLGELSSFSSAFHTPLERPWHRDELCPPCPECSTDSRDTQVATMDTLGMGTEQPSTSSDPPMARLSRGILSLQDLSVGCQGGFVSSRETSGFERTARLGAWARQCLSLGA